MNAKDNAIVDRFVELRAQGWSFARMAAELHVSKPTLITWSRKHQHRIHNLGALELEAFAEQHRISRRICLEHLSEDTRRIREELARRDLAEIPTTRLITLSALLRAEALRHSPPVQLIEPVPETEGGLYPVADPTITWEV